MEQPKGLTVTITFEMDLQGLSSKKVGDIKAFVEEMKGFQEEMDGAFEDDPELTERVQCDVKVVENYG